MATSRVRLALDIQYMTFKPLVSGEAPHPPPSHPSPPRRPDNAAAVPVSQPSINVATLHLADALGWLGLKNLLCVWG